MKKLILIFSVLLFQLNYSFANDKVIESLKEGGKLIFIRHALAQAMVIQKILNCKTVLPKEI